MAALAGAIKEKSASFVEVSRGTVLTVELIDGVHSGKNKPGDTFRAKVNEGVWVQGKVVLPPGTIVRGLITEAVSSGRVRGRAKLSLTLREVGMDGASYAVHTDTLSYVGEPHTGRHFGSWLGGALQGALYGVLFGGQEGAMIGAGAGAAAGAGSSVLKGKQDVEFSQGAKLMFELLEFLSVPEPPSAPVVPAGGAKPEENVPAKPEAKPST